MTARFRIGVDENGLGPLLGPMTVTAVLAEVDEKGHRAVERAARGQMKTRLGDSKALVSHGDVALGEAWARVLLEREGITPTDPDSLLERLSLDPTRVLESPCPKTAKDQCWHRNGEVFVADAQLMKDVRRDVERLEAGGINLRVARLAYVCVKSLNNAVDEKRSRFVVDLHCMERSIIELQSMAGEPVLAIAGKVGGLRQYEPAFGPLAARLRTVLQEKKENSAYWFPGLGEIRFVMDADASDRLVSIASLIGKYVRELGMSRIVRYHQQTTPTLADASGYHDPVTKTFVLGTQALRKKKKIPDDCFQRRSLDGP